MSEFLDRYFRETTGSTPADIEQSDDPFRGDSQSLTRAQQGSSIASSLLAIASANSQSRDLRRAAGDQLIAAEVEETETLRRANEQRRAHLKASGRMRVAFAASGVDLGSGTVKQLDREMRQAANETISHTKTRGYARANARRARARRLVARAAENFGGAVLGGVIKIGEAAASGGNSSQALGG